MFSKDMDKSIVSPFLTHGALVTMPVLYGIRTA